MIDFKAGDVFLTRNTNEIGNNNPGYWNHTAIKSTKDYIIEAQKIGVIAVPTMFFWERYPEILVLRTNIRLGSQMAQMAQTLVGRQYEVKASWIPRFTNKDNCVSVVRRSYESAVNQWMPWRRPDHILYSGMFSVVYHKIEYDTWVKPTEWYKGALHTFPEG
jgi:uncharacterized protein YycO